MPRLFAFCRCVGEAVLAKAGRALAGLVPFGDQLYDIAAHALKRWRDLNEAEDQQQALRQEFEQAAQEKLQDFERDMRRIVAEVAADQPPQVQEALTGYLSLIPARIRQTFSRPQDPSGRSAPPAWLIERPEDLLVFLPPRPPRFKAGDCPPNSKYVLTERLGAGGFGEVWKARHTLLKDRFAAFKFCLDPAARGDLLKHEARIIGQVMNQVDHPGIVKLQDVDYNPESPWLQFEFVPGGDLAELVSGWANDPARRVPLATKVIHTLARTVGYCHQLEPPVVHRDLKPTNVLVAPTADGKGRLKISDFGISGLVAVQALEEANRLTQGSPSMPTLLRYAATPLYASPQQKAGAKPDPRDDVHALGVMWYQLLLGNCLQPLGPDYRDDLAELGVCDDLIKLLAKCVASKAERRPKNAVELAELIARLPAVLERIEAQSVEVIAQDSLTPAEKRLHEAARRLAYAKAKRKRLSALQDVLKKNPQTLRNDREKSKQQENEAKNVELEQKEPESGKLQILLLQGRKNGYLTLSDIFLDRYTTLDSETLELAQQLLDVLEDNGIDLIWGLDDPLSHYHRGRVWLDKKAYDKAISEFDEAIRLAPRLGLPYFERAKAWQAKKEYGKSSSDFKEASRLDPDLCIDREPNRLVGLSFFQRDIQLTLSTRKDMQQLRKLRDKKDFSTDEKCAIPVAELALGDQLTQWLENQGINTVLDLIVHSPDELLVLGGLGLAGLKDIRMRLGELGLTLRDD